MFVETVLLEGHILDSHTLSKILDHILKQGGRYELMELSVGHRREDPTRAKLFLRTDSRERMNAVLTYIREQGGLIPEPANALLKPAPEDGVFPHGFYSTTNLETWIQVAGEEIRVHGEAMDLGICVEPAIRVARSVPMDGVRKGELYVCGTDGIRIIPLRRTDASGKDAFGFMQSEVSAEKPRQLAIRQVAAALRECHAQGGRNLLVLGPAVVHSGAMDAVSRVLETGVFDLLFGGNAVAAHDIEWALFGTSLGVDIQSGQPVPAGHRNHLRAINSIRASGGIRQAVEDGSIRRGIMYTAVRKGIDFLLAGSIRDDGPLPEVITDILEAKKTMRSMLEGVGVAVMVATALHSIATGNMLPARVRTFCVDIHPGTVTKLMDRGSSQTVPIVMDCESFFHELEEHLP